MRGQSCGVSRLWPGLCRSCIAPSLGQDCQHCPQCPHCLLLPHHLPPQKKSQESDLPLPLPLVPQEVLLSLLASPQNCFQIYPSDWCYCGLVNDRLPQDCLQREATLMKIQKMHTKKSMIHVGHLHISTTGYSGVLLRSLSLSFSLSSLMGRQEPSVKYSISSMSSLVSLRISDSSLKYKLLVRVASRVFTVKRQMNFYLLLSANLTALKQHWHYHKKANYINTKLQQCF